ncbi:hypothetical protein [Methylobacterium currus]|nr:hypothetical protein [Methylobacterium currus]
MFAVTGGDGRPYDMPAETALAGAVPVVAFAQTGATEQKTMPDHLAAKASLGGLIGPDADLLIPQGSVHVVIPTLTASRSWSLPDVDGYPYGQDLVIVDDGRTLGAGPTLAVIPLAGSGDAIAGYPSGITLADAGASVRLRRGLLSNVWVLV